MQFRTDFEYQHKKEIYIFTLLVKGKNFNKACKKAKKLGKKLFGKHLISYTIELCGEE